MNIDKKIIDDIYLSTDLCNVKKVTGKITEIDIPHLVYHDNELSIVNHTLRTELGHYNIATPYTRQQKKDLQQNFALDLDGMLLSMLINESKQHISKSIIGKMQEYGEQNYRDSYTKSEFRKDKFYKFLTKFKFVYKIFPNIPKEFKKIKDITVGAKNSSHILHNLINTILYESNELAKDTHIGPATHIIVNCKIGAALQDAENFIPSSDKIINTNGLPYLIGKLSNINIIIDPDMRWDDDSILLYRKNDNEIEPQLLVLYNSDETALDDIETPSCANKLNLSLYHSIIFRGNEKEAVSHFRKIYVNTTNLI